MNKILIFALLFVSSIACAEKLPGQFVYLSDFDPSIVQEMRYASNHNFIGRPIKGYKSAACILTRPAAEALRDVQTDLKKSGYTIKVYDCYRPQKAVDDFIAWSEQPAHQEMKAEYYPRVNKADFFKLGYVAGKSGHSRGSTVDLTIMQLPNHVVDMGTTYDFMDELSHSNNKAINKTAYKNRQFLHSVMERHGFVNLPTEWWHFTLKNEPYPKQYFNVDIQRALPAKLVIPSQSMQIIAVSTDNLNSLYATMQRYERHSSNASWVAVGDIIPVVIGKKGMAQVKREGDLRTPIGIFKIETIFGFAHQANQFRLPYVKLNATSLCVDDSASRYYNQLIDQHMIKQPDWQSAEQMRATPVYKLGAVISYNDKQQPYGGSCIFLHIWKNRSAGTAGCVAMSESALKQTLNWLNPAKHPVIAIFKN